jgi:hypothetical protein
MRTCWPPCGESRHPTCRRSESRRERDFILEHTLDSLDELAGYVASEFNRQDRKLRKEGERIYGKLAAILGFHTGGK